jgi:hypothetical protein
MPEREVNRDDWRAVHPDLAKQDPPNDPDDEERVYPEAGAA